jgi:hypothetical protein
MKKHKKVYAYTRTLGNDQMIIIYNLFRDQVKFSSSEWLLSNYSVEERVYGLFK